MIKVKEKNKKNLEIQQVVSSNSKKITEISITVPKALDFKKTMSTNEFFMKNVEKKKSLYKSKNPSLTLLYAKYLDKKEMPKEQLSTSLRLFSHQFLQKLKDYEVFIEKEAELEEISEILSETQKTLNSFRGMELSSQTHIDLFNKIDYLMSFEVEQFFLKMLKRLKSMKNSEDLIEVISKLAKTEREYREEKKYNKSDMYGNLCLIKAKSGERGKKATKDSYLRIVNKMDMNKKLIENPLKVSEEVFTFGKKEKYISLAISTGLIMLFFSFMIFQARMFGFDTTIHFVLGLALLYVFRDLFREEFRDYIYDKITTIKPQLKSFIYVPQNKDSVGITKTWFRKKDKIFQKDSTYKDNYELNFEEIIKLNQFDHHGFKKMKSTTSINLEPIMTQIIRDDKKLIVYDEENLIEELYLPRQYKLKLKIKETASKRGHFLKEKSDPKVVEKDYILIIDRTEIVSIREKK